MRVDRVALKPPGRGVGTACGGLRFASNPPYELVINWHICSVSPRDRGTARASPGASSLRSPRLHELAEAAVGCLLAVYGSFYFAVSWSSRGVLVVLDLKSHTILFLQARGHSVGKEIV
jgi:hypothetical protein